MQSALPDPRCGSLLRYGFPDPLIRKCPDGGGCYKCRKGSHSDCVCKSDENTGSNKNNGEDFLCSAAQGGLRGEQLRGVLCGLGAACFYTAVVILNKKIRDVDPYGRTIVQLFSAALVLLPYLLLTEKPGGIRLNAGLIGLLLLVGVVYTGLVYALYFGSMPNLRAQTIAILSYLDPVVALLVSALLLGERLTLAGMLGAVLILGAAILSEWSPGQGRGN